MSEPVRAIIWAVPRSRSNALIKSLSGINNSKIFHELYSTAFYFGPDSRIEPALPSLSTEATSEVDRKIVDGGCAFPSSVSSYKWVQKTLARDYPGKFVLAKEISVCLDYKYDSLPKGYRHVFLIRHPRDVFLSWKKLNYKLYLEQTNQTAVSFEDFQLDQLDTVTVPYKTFFKNSHELYQYLKDNQLDENPIIIDGDDLMNNPAGILAALCNKLELPYSAHLLTWDSGVSDTWTMGHIMKLMIQNSVVFENFSNSTGFQRRSPDKGTSSGDANVTADIQRCIDFSMPFYLKMYEQRLTVLDQV